MSVEVWWVISEDLNIKRIDHIDSECKEKSVSENNSRLPFCVFTCIRFNTSFEISYDGRISKLTQVTASVNRVGKP
jgi:hypothetical protein